MIFVVKKHSIIIVTLVCILAVMTFSLYRSGPNYDSTPAFSSPNSDHIILIDAGHGGEDGGAVGKGNVQEKELNLIIAKKLETILQDNGYLPLMTRVDDVSIHDTDNASIKNKKRSDLNNRLKMMDNSNAQVFISIHMNEFSESKYRGAQVFYSSNNEKSKLLGETMQARFKAELEGSQNREAKKADSNIFLLKKATIPAIIVECGFLSNPEDLALLQTEEYQDRVAQAIYSGLMDYFSKVNDTQTAPSNA